MSGSRHLLQDNTGNMAAALRVDILLATIATTAVIP